jgi:hypothetical protein
MSDDDTADVTEDQTEDTEAQEATEDTEQTEEDNDFDADKAREKIRKINSENRNLRKRATDAEAKAEGAKGSGERVTALEAENMRLRIGVKHGLPESLVKRLTGTTEEEILQDAEELMELFGGKKPPTQQPREKLRGGGDPTQQQSEDIEDVDKFAERIFRN